MSSDSKAEYQVNVSNPAKKDLKDLSRDVQRRIAPVLVSLSSTPRPTGVKKLKGCDAYRIREGDYRVIYDVNDNAKTVTVLAIRHRSAAYR